jgi:hypothetical protein
MTIAAFPAVTSTIACQDVVATRGASVYKAVGLTMVVVEVIRMCPAIGVVTIAVGINMRVVVISAECRRRWWL